MDSSYKKLTRSTSDRKIAGVCGGLAQYLNVDPTVVRIIFLIALICGTIGFWVYLVVWICAPEDNLLNQ
ncbi:MAG: PspC domain-containing protein [Bacteroidales bacterium]|nr:PspC domain-containing protein [Bacteroidales bacterium]